MAGMAETGTRRFEILVDGGTIVDGTGAPGFSGAVGIDREAAGGTARLTVLRDAEAIQDARALAHAVIDASGKVVAPGFIDLHSHSGLMILADPRHEPKVRQGVTTEVVGVDGLSYAPISADHLAELVEMNAGLDGWPDIRLDWESVGQYLDRFDRGMGVNVAFLVGNSALRLGTTGWDEVEASRRRTRRRWPRCSASRCRTARTGCRPASTIRPARTRRRRSSRISPPWPRSSAASTTRTCATRWATGSSTRSARRSTSGGGGALPPTSRTSTTGPRSRDRPSRCSSSSTTRAPKASTSRSTPTRTSGRAPGCLITVPPWVQAGGPGPTKERLADPAVRARIRGELEARGVLYAGAGGLGDIRLGYFARPEHLRFEGRTLGEVGRELGGDLVDVLCDLLLAEGLRLNQVTPGPHTDGIRRFYRHDVAMVGTDSTFVGAKPSPRSYGSYPRILGQFVRDEALLSLETAVAKMTSMPAARLGLKDRGRIADGWVADLVVFDPATVRANATYDEPRRFPDGIDHVLVNGIPVVADGEHTGATPGRALRRGRD